MSKRYVTLGSLILVLIWLCAAVAPIAASEGGGGQGSVDPYYGAFSTEIPITVPPFRGLEPTLKLLYNSGSGNGVVGVGWGVSAASTIQRAAPGGGAPRYTSSDAFYLDGQELIPDTSMGGHFSTRIKNYTRIQRDEANNRWYIWGTNGNKATYSAIYWINNNFTGTFRWMLTSMQDRNGNTVNYNYWCDPAQDCYLGDIQYNGTVIQFYYEGRPDPMRFATGAYLGSTNYRLKSIAVRVSNNLARAYKLGYTTSSNTGRSLLANVQQCGRDASVDGNGNVSGGTCLPAMTFGWQNPSLTYGLLGQDTGWHYHDYPYVQQWFTGDGNGDSKSDFMMVHNANGLTRLHAAFSYGNGTYALTAQDTGWSYSGDRNAQRWFTGDSNGDGKSDFMMVWNYNGTARLHTAFSNGDGTYMLAGQDTGWSYHGDPQLQQWFIGDANGDGKSDFMMVYNANGKTRLHAALSNGNGTYTLTGQDTGWGYSGDPNFQQWLIGDANGDGKSDFMMLWNHNNTARLHTALSNGDGTYALTGQDTGWSYSGDRNIQQWFIGDGNGDGQSDFMMVWNYNGTARLHTAFSNGNGVFTLTGQDTGWSYSGNRDLQQWGIGDANGDGRSDFMMVLNANGQARLHSAASTGNGGFLLTGQDTTWSYTGDPNQQQWLLGDANGDARGNWMMLWKIGPQVRLHTAQTDGLLTDAITTLANGIGGSTGIQYTPSSAWSNTAMPQGALLWTVSALTTSDGRGNSNTINYSYQGGLWSWSERRFLGFRRVTAVLDPQGNYTETYYWQKEGSIAKPEVTYYRNATGQIFSYSNYQYTENTSPPYTSLLTSQWNYECNLTTTCRRALTQYSYDQYANVVQTLEYGDYDISGDERTTYRGYVPNTSAYLVSLPAYENVYQGLGTGGTLLRQMLYIYDSNSNYTQAPTKGNLTKERAWLNTTGGYADTTYTYDQWGNQTGTTNPVGRTTTMQYDPTYRVYVTQRCNALNQCDSQGWDGVLSMPTSLTNANGRQTTFAYDALGRQTGQTTPDGTRTIQYLNWGNPTTQRIRTTLPDGSADGLWEETYQDGLGRVYKVLREGGVLQEWQFSGASGRVWKESLPYKAGETVRWTTYTYDGLMRQRTATNPDGTVAEVVYGMDGNGKPYLARYDELNNEIVEWHDAYGNLIQVREKNGAQYYYTAYQYDVRGNLTRIVDHDGRHTTFTYDSLGRRTAQSDPNMGAWSYAYNLVGNLTSQTDAKNQTITYTYDALGRLTSKNWAGGAANWYYDESGYGYSIGHLTRRTYPGGSESHTYDALGRVTASTRCVDTVCKTVNVAFDALGRPTSHTYPGGEVVTYTYNSAGQLTGVSNYVTNIEYNSRGQITKLTYSNGTENTFAYNDQRAWLSTATVKKGSTTLFNGSYTYANNGRVTGQNSSTNALSNNLSYTYDGLNRLTGVSGGQSSSWSYSPTGNITAGPGGAYTYGDSAHPHAVTARGGRTYTYDANGNMLSGDGRTLAWNVDNMLTAVTLDGNGGTATYTYDAGERRIKKSYAGNTTRYFGQVEDENGVQSIYIYAGPVMVARNRGGVRSWYHSDRLGSVVMLTDASGNKIKGYDYRPFGAVAGESGSAANSRGYTNHVMDSETGLIYMGARYYDPELGRFISPDNVIPNASNPQSLNCYSYVYNNPLSYTDPSGHAPVMAVVSAIVAVATAAPAVVAVAVIGAACSIAGMALKSPVLASIGGIMLGFTGGFAMPIGGSALAGGLLGAAVAGMTSPISPLNPGMKQAVGWAYTAYGLIRSFSDARSNQKTPEDAVPYTDGMDPSLIAGGGDGLGLGWMSPSQEGAERYLNTLDPHNQGRWAVRGFAGRGLKHSETHLFLNGQRVGSLQGNGLGAGLYKLTTVNSPFTAMIPVTRAQLSMMVDKAYSHWGPWGLTWVCHDVTRSVLGVVNAQHHMDTLWSANGLGYAGARLIGIPGSVGTTPPTYINWFWGNAVNKLGN